MTQVTPWSANRAGLVIDAALAEWERGVRDVADSAVDARFAGFDRFE